MAAAVTVDPAPGADAWEVTWAADPPAPVVRFPADDPLVNADLLRDALRAAPGGLLLRWSRVPSRAALQSIYDVFWAHGVALHPPPAEALAAWDDLRAQAAGPLVLVGETLDSLVAGRNVPAGLLGHPQLLVGALGFPRALFEREHVRIASDLHERLGRLASPKPKVQMYVVDNLPVPLLLWYEAQRDVAMLLLQEYCHLMWARVPGLRVWYWDLCPTGVPPTLVARHFEAAQILPAWGALVAGTLGSGVPLPSAATLDAYTGRRLQDPDGVHMATADLDRPGALTLHLGDACFLAVRDPDAAETELRCVRAPRTAAELPRWVGDLLGEMAAASGRLEAYAVERAVDRFLDWFAGQPVGADVRLLRSVDWAKLPLVWRPAVLRDVPYTVTAAQSDAAQGRLIRALAREWDAEETLSDALARLNRITGVAAA